MKDKNKQNEIATQKIRTDILNCVLPPNSQLKILTLSKKYEIGATPIREALNKLTLSGLINIEPMRGFFVTPISIAQMSDIYKTRLMIFTEILKQAIENGDDSWEGNIIAKLYQFNKYHESPPYEFETWQEKIHDVHLAMMDACDSPTLKKLHTLLFSQSERYRIIWYKDKFKIDKNKNQLPTREESLLEPLTQAVINRDTDLAIKIYKKKSEDCTINITKKLKSIGITE